MQAKLHVAVVGAGVVGLSTALELANRGHRVTVFERHAVGTPFGSSHGPSRIIRLAYGDARYIPLCRASYDGWRRLENETGESLMVITGGVDFGDSELPSLRNVARSLEACGVAHDVLSADELSRVYPQIRPPRRSLAVVQRDAGILDADRCVATLAEAARRRGVEIREGERVSAVEPRGSGAVLRIDEGSSDVDRVVIAAGPGMPSFLRELGIALDLTVSKEQAVYLEPADAEAFHPGRFPIVIRHFAEPRLSSVFPVFRAPGVKMMIEHKRAVADDEDFRVDDERAEEVRLAAVDLIPGLTGRIRKVETCRYTLTGDEDFLLDVHPEHPQIVLASACSGHGFKFGPVLGEALADLAVDAPCRFDLGMFRLGRPALGQPAVQENQAPGAPQPESSDE